MSNGRTCNGIEAALLIVSVTVLGMALGNLYTVQQMEELKSEVAQQRELIASQQELIDGVLSTVDEAIDLIESEQVVEIMGRNGSPNWDYDYEYVLRVVTAECGGEPLDGQMAVAQTILERALEWDMTPEEVVKQRGQYAKPVSAMKVTDSVREACDRVFNDGYKVVNAPIKWFYSTRNGFVSKNHEKRTFVIEIGNHRFFM